MSRERISLSRAAVSYSSRHSVFSRSPTSRRHRVSTCRVVKARVRSGISRRRSSPRVGSSASQPWSCHHRVADRNVANSRFQVAGATPS